MRIYIIVVHNVVIQLSKKSNYMKRLLQLTTLISLLSLTSKGQETIEEKVSRLETEFKVVKDRQRIVDKLDYNTIRTNLTTAVELHDQINEVYGFIKGDVATADVYNKLASVNSPASDILGFKFSNIIVSKASEVFNSKEFKDIPEKKKNKFLTIVDKIINNPIASVVQSTFPITGTVRSVITAAATFFSEPDVELDVKRSSGKVTSVNVKDIKGDTGLDNKFIEKYLGTLQPYITFYEKLEYSNLQYDVATKELLKNYKNLPDLIKGFETDMNTKLGFNGNINMTLVQKTGEIDKLSEFNQSGVKDFNYTNFISDQKILDANNIAKQVGMMAIELENFYSEFVKIVNDKFDADKEILEEAKNLEGAKPDKVQEVIKSIDNLQKSGTVEKYQKNILKIITLRNKITY